MSWDTIVGLAVGAFAGMALLLVIAWRLNDDPIVVAEDEDAVRAVVLDALGTGLGLLMLGRGARLERVEPGTYRIERVRDSREEATRGD